MEGDAIGDAGTKFLKYAFFGSWGSVGMPIELLGASLLSHPVSCGQRDDSNGRGIRHGPIIHLLVGFGTRLVKFDGLL